MANKEKKVKEVKEEEKESDYERRWKSFKQWYMMQEATKMDKTFSKKKEKDAKKLDRPKGDYLVIDKEGKGHLPVKDNGKPNPRLMGSAHAALTKGFRGQKYKGPNKSSALMKLRMLYKKIGKEMPED